MFRKHIPRQKPGQIIESRDLNAFNQEVSWLTRLRGTGGVQITNTPGGRLIRPAVQDSVWATITGPPNDIGGYPWAEQVKIQSGWMPTGRVGGNTKGEAGYDPTYERRTGSTTVPVSERRFQMVRANTSGEWLFAFRLCVGRLFVTITTCGLPAEGNTIQLIQNGVVIADCVAEAGSFPGIGCEFDNVVQGDYTIRVLSPQGESDQVDFTMPPGCETQTESVPLECSGIPQQVTFPKNPPGEFNYPFTTVNPVTLTYQPLPGIVQQPVIFLPDGSTPTSCYTFPANLWLSPQAIEPITGLPTYVFMYSGCGLVIGVLFQGRDAFGGTPWFWALSNIVDIADEGPPPNTCNPFSLPNGELVNVSEPIPFTGPPVTGTHGPNDGPMRSGAPVLVGLYDRTTGKCLPLP